MPNHRHTARACLAATSLALMSAAAADPGDVLWSAEAEMNVTGPALVAPNGDVLWAGTEGCLGGTVGLYRLSPDGDLIWEWPSGGTNGLFSVAPDGTIYAGDIIAGGLPAVRALNPDGSTLWEYIFPDDNTYGFIGGPDIGPDGNIYITTDVPFGMGYLVSLTPQGQYRWQVDGFANGAGCPPSRHVFSAGRVFKAESITPIPAGEFGSSSGFVAVTLEGQIDWYEQFNIGESSGARQIEVLPDGRLVTKDYDTIYAMAPDSGGVAWSTSFGFPGELTAPTIGPEGNVFAVHGQDDLVSLDENGALRWTAENVVPHLFASRVGISPDGSLVAFAHSSSDGCPMSPFICRGGLVVLDAHDGSVLFSMLLPETPGGQPVAALFAPTFSADGGAVYVAARALPAYGSGGEDVNLSYLFSIDVGACVADFTGDGLVDSSDFFSFIASFLGAAPDADITGEGETDSADFFAFIDAFLGGC